MEDVVAKTGFLFAVLLVVGAFAWTTNLGMGAVLLGFLGGFVLAMIISFSKSIKPGLVVAYAALEGLALGTISSYYESFYPGIVSQAVIGTIAAFTGVLIMYRNGTLRATPQFTRTLIGAAIAISIVGVIPGLVFQLLKTNALSYLRKLQQKIQADASQIDNYLEQRVVILENLAGLLAKSIDLDKDVMKTISAYRGGINPNQDSNRNEASAALDSVASRINVAFEAYPELRASREHCRGDATELLPAERNYSCTNPV